MKYRVFRFVTNIEYQDVEVSEKTHEKEELESNEHETLAYYSAKSSKDSQWKFMQGTHSIFKKIFPTKYYNNKKE